MSSYQLSAGPRPAALLAGALERLPKWAICIPIVLQWLWLWLRFGGATVPCAANPGITAGGMVGEGKREYFDSMGPLARAATAPWTSVRNTPQLDHNALLAAITKAGLSFPLIAKPDLGLCGHGVRRIDSLEELADYASAYPVNETIVLQHYLAMEHEAGIFYARDPRTGAGRIIGLALRRYPHVTGDGHATVGALMQADPRARRIAASDRHLCKVDLLRVPAVGETVRLATIGSTRVGGLYLDGAALITPALIAAIDAIARDMGAFHFGRFDVRFASEEALRQGGGFYIMEVNGAGSEAIEAWDPATGLFAGLGQVFAKQRLLFEIGAANLRRGAPATGLFELMRLNWRQNRLLDAYPPSN